MYNRILKYAKACALPTLTVDADSWDVMTAGEDLLLNYTLVH